ncbi:MAG: hypothetical protein QOH32_1224 [Bradyrhizobium sp.]|jgi:hypothetical protein|nr:hypothetical protein [Bradyrhizobium sp.]
MLTRPKHSLDRRLTLNRNGRAGGVQEDAFVREEVRSDMIPVIS